MTSPRFPCPRCGIGQPYTEGATIGQREPQYIQTTDCPCPRPRCPFCHATLDWQDRCPTVECFMWFTVVPNPEIA